MYAKSENEISLRNQGAQKDVKIKNRGALSGPIFITENWTSGCAKKGKFLNALPDIRRAIFDKITESAG